MMRMINYLATVAAVSLLLSVGAFANDTNTGKFDLAQTAKVGSTVLKPGHYKAEWSGTDDNLSVSIMQYGKTVATTHAKLQEMAKPASYDAVTVRNLPDKSKRVEEIEFNHRKGELVFAAAKAKNKA